MRRHAAAQCVQFIATFQRRHNPPLGMFFGNSLDPLRHPGVIRTFSLNIAISSSQWASKPAEMNSISG